MQLGTTRSQVMETPPAAVISARSCQSTRSFGCAQQSTDRIASVGKLCRPHKMTVCLQVKGINDFDGRNMTALQRHQLGVETGWVATASNRREWTFVQFSKDMSPEGESLYHRLNNLGAWPCRASRDAAACATDGRPLPVVQASTSRMHTFAKRVMRTSSRS